MLKLPNVTADGAKDDVAVPVTIYYPRTNQPTGAIVWVRIAPQADLYDIARKCRRHEVDPGTRQMRQTVDGVRVQQIAMARYIMRWTGMAGSDGTDLPCVPAVFNALPEWVVDQITEGIRGVPIVEDDEAAADAPEVRAAGFRESA